MIKYSFLIKNKIPAIGFSRILDMIFYETSTINGAKISYTFFFHVKIYFYPSTVRIGFDPWSK